MRVYTATFDIEKLLDMKLYSANNLREALEERAWDRFVREKDPERDDYEARFGIDGQFVLVSFEG